MIVVKDIRALQFMSFEDCLSHFLPTAKIIRVFYGLNWLSLQQKYIPNNVDIFWIRVEHPNMTDIFQECVNKASCSNTPDELIFMDSSTIEGIKILEQYK